MRTVVRPVSLLVVSVGLAALSAQSIAAVDAGKPTVEGQLCALAGICGDVPSTPQMTKEAPATKGFRLARSAAAAPVVEPAPITKGFRLARSTPVTAAVKPTPRYRPAVANRVSAVARRKADLAITFEAGSDRITEQGLESARVFQQTLMVPALRGKRFVIEGHTDASGSATKNLELSRRRAQAVADFLISQNVEPSRIEVKGRGSASPLPGHRKNDPANRRVEAELIS